MRLRARNNSGGYGYNQSKPGQQQSVSGQNPWLPNTASRGDTGSSGENSDRQGMGFFGGFRQRQNTYNGSGRQQNNAQVGSGAGQNGIFGRQNANSNNKHEANNNRNKPNGNSPSNSGWFGWPGAANEQHVSPPTHDTRGRLMQPRSIQDAQQPYTPLGAQQRMGMAQQGAWQNGTHRQGTAQQGMYQQGAAQQGMHQQGATQQGMHQQGADQQGMQRQGAAQLGMYQQGTTQQGMNLQGMNQQGAAQQGTTQQGMSHTMPDYGSQPMLPATADQLKSLNRGLPDGVVYQPLDMKGLSAQPSIPVMPNPINEHTPSPAHHPTPSQPPLSAPEAHTQPSMKTPEFPPLSPTKAPIFHMPPQMTATEPVASPPTEASLTSAHNPLGFMERFIQNERNGSVYYKYLASISPTSEIRGIINEIGDSCKRRRDAFAAIYADKAEKPFIPNEVDINNRVSFREGIKLAIKEESSSLRKLCDACDNTTDARLISFLGQQMHKKTADISFLHLINSKIS